MSTRLRFFVRAHPPFHVAVSVLVLASAPIPKFGIRSGTFATNFELEGHQQIHDSSAVLDLKFLRAFAAM
jgi:hypothetical protein